MSKQLFLVLISLFWFNSEVAWNRSDDGSGAQLRVAYLYRKSISSFDPQDIQTLAEALLAENLYSRLITIDDKGNYRPELSEDIFWQRDSLILKIKRVLSTKGEMLSAKDVYFSLLRIVIRNSNTHGSLKNLICPSDKVESIRDLCSGLMIDGDKIILKPYKAGYRSFILPLLASMDHSIIPLKALDFTKRDIPIIDHFNSTGVYGVQDSDNKGNIQLMVNRAHFLYRPNIAARVILHSASVEEALEGFRNGRYDLVADEFGNVEVDEYLKGTRSISVHRTEDISLYKLGFTVRAMDTLTSHERICIGQKFKKEIIRNLMPSGARVTDEFFPQFSEGVLTDIQKDDLTDYLKSFEHCSFSKTITLMVPPKRSAALRFITASLPWIKIVEANQPPWTMEVKKQPEMYFTQTDSSFYDSGTLINYHFQTGSFGRPSKAKLWVTKYMSTESKTDRLKMVRDLHLNFLKEGFVTPIYVAPYITFAKRNVNLSNLSKFYAGTPLWKIVIE